MSTELLALAAAAELCVQAAASALRRSARAALQSVLLL
jgi:hypothetical protein